MFTDLTLSGKPCAMRLIHGERLRREVASRCDGPGFVCAVRCVLLRSCRVCEMRSISLLRRPTLNLLTRHNASAAHGQSMCHSPAKVMTAVAANAILVSRLAFKIGTVTWRAFDLNFGLAGLDTSLSTHDFLNSPASPLFHS